MSRTQGLLCLFLVMPCSGCGVVSLHPLHSKEVAAHDDNLVGTWNHEFDDPMSRDHGKYPWKITSYQKGEYTIEFQFHKELKQERCVYNAQLARIGSDYYLDLWPSILGARMVDEVNLLQVHHFWQIKIEKNALTVRGIDRTKLAQLLKAGKAGVVAEEVGKKLVLTSRTADLQAFIQKHGDKILGEPWHFRRMTEQASKEKK